MAAVKSAQPLLVRRANVLVPLLLAVSSLAGFVGTTLLGMSWETRLLTALPALVLVAIWFARQFVLKHNPSLDAKLSAWESRGHTPTRKRVWAVTLVALSGACAGLAVRWAEQRSTCLLVSSLCLSLFFGYLAWQYASKNTAKRALFICLAGFFLNTQSNYFVNATDKDRTEKLLTNLGSDVKRLLEAQGTDIEASRKAAEEAKAAAIQTEATLGGINRAMDEALTERDMATKEAEKQARIAEANARAAEWESYCSSIAAAQTAIHRRELATARRLLESAPERLRQWEWRYLESALDDSLVVMTGHSASVTTASFDSSGAYAITASSDGTARVWDTHSGQELKILRASGGKVTWAGFNKDGTLIATAHFDGSARLWNWRTDLEPVTLRGHTGAIHTATLSRDGTKLLTSSLDHSARVWSVPTGELLAVCSGHSEWVTAAAFSSDASRVVTGSWDRTTRVWDAHTGAQIDSYPSGIPTRVGFCGFHAVVACSLDGTIRHWGVSFKIDHDKELERLLARGGGGASPITAATISGGLSCRILTGSADGTVRIFEEFSDTAAKSWPVHAAPVTSVSPDPRGSRVVTASEDNTACILHVSSGVVVARLVGHDQKVVNADFSPDGTRVLTASDDGTARIWDATQTDLWSGAQLRTSRLSSGFASPDLKHVARKSENVVEVVEVETGETISSLAGHEDRVNAVAFSPSGELLATGSVDGTVLTWDLKSGKQLASLKGHVANVNRVEFDRANSLVVSASSDNTARIWNAQSGRCLATLQGHTRSVVWATFSDDGKLVATASHDMTARTWDVSSGTCTAILTGHGAPVASIQFSGDGQHILTSSGDGSARLWSNRGAELLALTDPGNSMTYATFTPNGQRIVTGSADGTVQIWDAVSGRSLLTLGSDVGSIKAVRFEDTGTRIIAIGTNNRMRSWDSLPRRSRPN